MTARYFYRDPLAAAWMAKHFEMKFDGINVSFTERNKGLPCIFEIYEISEENRQAKGPIVHADSLHMLEPHVGDVFQFPGGFGVVEHDGNIEFARRIGARIIQRNGIAFHWPEIEP